MSPDACAWLPPDTPPPAAAQALLAEAVEDWSQHWFATPPKVPTRLSRAACGDFTWRGSACGIMLGVGADAMVRVGGWMLDVPSHARAPHERALLEELAEPCVADLIAHLARAGDAAAAGWRPCVHPYGWNVLIGGRDAPLAVGLTDAAFARLVRRALPEPERIALGSGAAALAAVHVNVGAALGRADLILADLRGLDIGDVVVLDRALADPVPIAIDGRAMPRGTVRVVASPSHPTLDIVEAATQP